jgi:hypothetical protein
VLGSNPDWGTDYPKSYSSWFSSVSPDKCHDSVSTIGHVCFLTSRDFHLYRLVKKSAILLRSQHGRKHIRRWPRERWLTMCKLVWLLAFLIMLLCQASELQGWIIMRIHCIIWDTLRPTFLHHSYLRNLVTLVLIIVSLLKQEPEFRFLQGSRDISLFQSVHTGFGTHPASYAMGSSRYFPSW